MSKESFITYLSVIVAILVGIITVFIYKLQLYKNTTSNIKKKKMICNVLMLILSIPLCIIFYMIKFQDLQNIFDNNDENNNDENNNDENNNDENNNDENNNDENNIIKETKFEWEIAYKQFIISYYNFISEIVGDEFKPERCKFALYDIDKDEIPELFTCYDYNVDNICSYDIEEKQILRISTPFISNFQSLYGSWSENRLIVLTEGATFYTNSLIIFSKSGGGMGYYRLIKTDTFSEIILSSGDIFEAVYIKQKYDDIAYEINKEEYDQEKKNILYNSHKIIFYTIDYIKDTDIPLYITEMFYYD